MRNVLEIEPGDAIEALALSYFSLLVRRTAAIALAVHFVERVLDAGTIALLEYRKRHRDGYRMLLADIAHIE